MRSLVPLTSKWIPVNSMSGEGEGYLHDGFLSLFGRQREEPSNVARSSDATHAIVKYMK